MKDITQSKNSISSSATTLPIKQSVAIISFSNLPQDCRVQRQITFLKNEFEVTAIAYNCNQMTMSNVEFISLKQPQRSILKKGWRAFQLLTHQFENAYWEHDSIQEALQKTSSSTFNPDFIIANDIETLPLALKLAKKATPHSIPKKIIFDAHEYAPREFEDLWVWRMFYQKYKTYLCQQYIPKADDMLTVSTGIIEEYQRHFNKSASLLTNAPFRIDLQPRPTQKDKIRMICHGGAMPSRKLENLIHVMDELDNRYELHLMLLPTDRKYYQQLVDLASKSKSKQIYFKDPVPVDHVVSTVHQYDIGIYLLEPLNFNSLHALPNKFFDFIQARLAVAIGPSPEMAKLVKKYDCGIVSTDFTAKSLAQQLKQLDHSQIDIYKQNAHRAAQELSAEANQQVLLNMLRR